MNRPTLPEEAENRLSPLRAKLRAHRNKRIRPAQDDKVLADWNALAITGLAQAAKAVSRESYLHAARRAYDFILGAMLEKDGRILHCWRNGETSASAFASDQAAMMEATLVLATIDTERTAKYLEMAEQSATVLQRLFHRPDGGYFLTARDSSDLIQRPFAIADEATPNCNAQAALAFSKLYLLTGKAAYRDQADALFEAVAAEIPKNVFATASLLSAFDTRLHAKEIIVLVPKGSDTNPFFRHLQERADPAHLVFILEDSVPFEEPHPAAGKTALNNAVTLYVCKEGTCSLPIQTLEVLQELL